VRRVAQADLVFLGKLLGIGLPCCCTAWRPMSMTLPMSKAMAGDAASKTATDTRFICVLLHPPSRR
jgi:glutamate-1-semialdehyde aminotransferase